MDLHAQQLGEYLWLHVNQHILNKPEMYTQSGRSVRCFVLVLFSQKLPSHPRKWTLFFHFFVALHYCLTLLYHSLMTRLAPLDKLNNGRREPEEMASRRHETCYTHWKSGKTLVGIFIAVNNTNKISVLHLMWQWLPMNMSLFRLRWVWTAVHMAMPYSESELNCFNTGTLLCK